MPGPRTSWLVFDLNLQGATTATVETVIPFAGLIQEVWVGTAVIPTTGTLAIAKAGTNILSATNVNLAALAAGVGASQTLATANTTKRVAAGNVLKATWTISSAGSFVGGSCHVFIEPDLT